MYHIRFENEGCPDFFRNLVWILKGVIGYMTFLKSDQIFADIFNETAQDHMHRILQVLEMYVVVILPIYRRSNEI